MASRRAIQVGGAAVGVGAVYYLYAAGGNPSVAEKKLEHDVSAAGARLKGQDLSANEAQKKGEVLAKEAGATIDRTVDSVRGEVKHADQVITAKMHEAGSKLDHLKDDGAKKIDAAYKDTSKELQQTADTFDKTVNKKTAEAKSGISSWLGFGGK
ncbi:MAG: hypothetical protein LQ348_003156 [Seirophora lacunosa]|nr:MAG: hypothetical protein LQ344_002043 [Seirophora lacunosa]KAI4192403.1 MAG: hypothetical protein LQ348_003156 [Seirophora lacunosa]